MFLNCTKILTHILSIGLWTKHSKQPVTSPLTCRRGLSNLMFNTLRPRQDGRHFPDDILKCIFLNENVWISLTISLKCVRKVRINNIPSSVQIMAWRQPGDKLLSEPMMVILLTHICVTRPQWVKTSSFLRCHCHGRTGCDEPVWIVIDHFCMACIHNADGPQILRSREVSRPRVYTFWLL